MCRLLVLLGVLVSMVAPLHAQQQKREPQDILFIAVDDLNDWVGYLGGHPQTQTPNLDKLAARGMAFTNAQSPSAVCNAVRTALLTGLRPSTSGMYGNGPDWRSQAVFKGKQTLPRFFRDNGYATRGAGKIFHAHTYVRGGLAGFNDTSAWEDFFPALDRQLPDELDPPTVPAIGGSWGRMFDWAGLAADDAAMGDGQVTNWVVQQIKARGDGPRFTAAGIYRPHNPWYVPQKYLDKFPLAGIKLPAHIANDLADVPPIAANRSELNSLEVHKWLLANGRWNEGVQAYLASINFADAMVGQLLDALDASGRTNRTIIVLWSDHGFHLGEKERWHKFTLWRESLHVPFIIVAPGITKPGSRSAAPVSLMDIYPTLAELAGLKAPDHVEGRSLVPLLKNPGRRWDFTTLSTFGYRNHAVVSDKYKYIRYSDGSEELYDTRKDPREWTNLAGQQNLARVKQELAGKLPDNDATDLARRGAGPGNAPAAN
jgi:arylsulfatase A-like enzyme